MKLIELQTEVNPLISPYELRPGMKIFVNSLLYTVIEPISVTYTDSPTITVIVKRGSIAYSLEMLENEEIETYLGY
jgi:hypothetical protein